MPILPIFVPKLAVQAVDASRRNMDHIKDKTMRTMHQKLALLLAVIFLFSSCYNAGSGAYNGASMGALLGGALGGLQGGPRGHDRGTIIGILVGGAAGAAIGAAQEAKRERAYEEARAQARVERPTRADRRNSRRRQTERQERQQQAADTYAYSQPATQGQGMPQEQTMPQEQGVQYGDNAGGNQYGQAEPTSVLTLRNLRFVGEDGNQAINRGETCKIIFELANSSGRTVTDVVPYVFESNGNDQLEISPTARIESIRNGDAVRYTAHVKASQKLKDGTAYFCIQVATDGGEFVTLRTFSVATAKK